MFRKLLRENYREFKRSESKSRRLKEDIDIDNELESEINAEVEEQDCAVKTAAEVIAAYQNANKWLDSVKEAIYINMNCPFFSSFVHTLAHTMPARFDKFGDILHTVNMEIPYPATAEIFKKPENIDEAFEIIFSTLDAIKTALNAFIKCTDEKYHGMACAAEACLNDIEGEYPMLYRLQAKAKECGEDTITFDKFVGQYNEHKGELLENLNEADEEIDDEIEIIDDDGKDAKEEARKARKHAAEFRRAHREGKDKVEDLIDIEDEE